MPALRLRHGWGGDLDRVPKAIGQETSPAEVCRQTKRAIEPLGEHALGGGGLVVEEGAVVRGEDRGDQVNFPSSSPGALGGSGAALPI